MFFVDSASDDVGIGTQHQMVITLQMVLNLFSYICQTLMQLNSSSGTVCSLEFTDNATNRQIHYFHGNNSLTFTVTITQHFSTLQMVI